MQGRQIAAPLSLAELEMRAHALVGCRLDELADTLGLDPTPAAASACRKGKAGALIERALGASAGSRSQPDFVGLGVELKTVPLDVNGRPRESTYVCALRLSAAERAEWRTSSVRTKLAHVLFVPIVQAPGQAANAGSARVGAPLFWRPTPEQESVLRADFDDLMGLVALGRIEALTARLGRWLQVRPKARDGRARTRAFGFDDAPIAALPRGFYLRARFTGALLRDPATTEP